MSFCFSKPNKLHAQKPLKIGFLVASIELGSNVAYAKAIYALKALYPCKLIVFGNTITTALYSQAKHIDHLIDIAINTWQITDKSPTAQKSYAPLRAKQIATISSFSCDYLILSDAKSAFLRFALATNAKRVLCARKFISLLAPRARTLPIYSKPKYKSMPFEHILLHLVRMIDTARYDEYIHSIPLLANARLHASPKVQEKIDKIFTYKNARYWGGGGVTSTLP